jgi:hypothetical protein
MLGGFARRQVAGGMFFGPLLVGVVYGLVQALVPDLRLDFFYMQSPFMFTSLSGVAIAFACRPVLLRIEWTRPVAMALGVALVAGIGPLGDWVVSALIVQAHLAAFPLNLPESGLGLALGALLAGVLMGTMFRPRSGRLDAQALWARWRYYPWPRRIGRLALLAAAAVLLWVVLSAMDARQEESATVLYVPLVEPNYWLRMQGLWMGAAPAASLAATALLVVLLWVRALLLLGPLVPIALAIRGSWLQLTIVFTALLFVLGEFAPLMADQPYPSLRWLVLRTVLGLARSALLGGLMAALFGVIRRGPTEPAESALAA